MAQGPKPLTLMADPAASRPWWRDAVPYQVYVRGFLDSTGEGVGDLAGVRADLPNPRELGVDGVWLSPFRPSPQHEHGYDVADRCDVDPVHGDLAEHMVTPEQPDLDRRDPRVSRSFERVLRRWPDRGVDGFRIDVAAGRFKHPDLLDSLDPEADERTRDSVNPLAWNQPEAHGVRRRRRSICEEYTCRDGQERLLVGEDSVPTASDQAAYVRPDELHRAVSFHLLSVPWNAEVFRVTVTSVLQDIATTGSTVTWVLNNHDQVRSVAYGNESAVQATQRARAAALLMLALPGAACLYQGEEPGLPEVVDLPDEVLTDPILRHTGSRLRVRDGCRVPLPRSGRISPLGLTAGKSPGRSWLPQPEWFAEHTTDREPLDTGSLLPLYRDASRLRSRLPQQGDGTPTWIESPPQVLAFERGDGLVCAVNFADQPVPAPLPGAPLLSSRPTPAGVLDGATAAWWINES